MTSSKEPFKKPNMDAVDIPKITKHKKKITEKKATK